MQTSEYRVTMVHDNGTIKIVVTASNASAAVDAVLRLQGAPRRSVWLVETRPLQSERIDDDTWRLVPGSQWGRVVHTNPFAPDPANPFRVYSSEELETVAGGGKGQDEMHEELSRREDLANAVELWERLCAVPFVRGETQGYYTHSTAYLTPDVSDRAGNVHRMPDREELEALVLSDGEETDYPVHEVETRPFILEHVSTNPWSGDDRLYPITLTLISCGDYHGSDIDAANNRALDGVPGVEVREPNTGGQGSVFNVSTTVVGQMSSFENATNPGDTDREPATRRADALEWLESLVRQMEGLQDYALLNEEEHSKYLEELAEEAWDNHLESDTFDALRDIADSSPTFVGDPDEWIEGLRAEEESTPRVHDAYFAFEDNEWTVSSLSEGATNARHGEAVKHVARTVFGWNVP